MPINTQQRKSVTKKLDISPPIIKGRGPLNNPHVSKDEVLARMLENKSVRSVANGPGGYRLSIDENGGYMNGVPSVTLAKLPDATSAQLGSRIYMPRSEFFNSGGGAAVYMPERGMVWETNGVRWIPADCQQTLAVVRGTVAAPIVNGQTAGVLNTWTPFALPGGWPSLPAELIYPGLVIEVEVWGGHGATSANSTVLGVQMGTSTASSNNGNVLIAASGPLTAGAGKSAKVKNSAIVTNGRDLMVDAPTSSGVTSSMIPNGGYATNAANDGDNLGQLILDHVSKLAATNGSLTYIMPSFFQFVNTTDTNNLYYFKITLRSE